MNGPVVDWLALSTGIGITLSLVLAASALAIRISTSPIHKLKLGTLCMASCWCLLALQLVPLPRPAFEWLDRIAAGETAKEQLAWDWDLERTDANGPATFHSPETSTT